MADVTIYRTEKPNTLGGTWNAGFSEFQIPSAGISLTAAGTYTIPGDFKDEHMIILALGGSSAGSIEITKGDGYASPSANKVFAIPQGKYQFFTLDSSRFADTKTGKIEIKATNCSFIVMAPRV